MRQIHTVVSSKNSSLHESYREINIVVTLARQEILLGAPTYFVQLIARECAFQFEVFFC
jgi:hypothetical protein